MKNSLLTEREVHSFKGILDRIDAAMKDCGIANYAELNKRITEKRGTCPPLSTYTKMQSKSYDDSFYRISIDNLYVIAEELNVTTDYLLGKPANETGSKVLSINGLSKTALKNLENISGKADPFVGSSSKYYRTRAEKKMAALNWILEHINMDDQNANNDFLEAIYFLVMTRFENHRGGDTEIVLNSIDTHEEFNEYKKALFRLKHPVHFDDGNGHLITHEDIDQQNVHSARRAYVEREWWNRERRYTINQFLKNNAVNIVDPVTHDSIWVSLGNPLDTIKKCLMDIIEDWQEEYGDTYEKLKKRQKDEEDAWLKEVENEPYPGDPDYIYPEIEEEEEVPEELLYREPYLRGLNESQMKMYMMLQFLEDNAIELESMSDDGKLRLKGEELLKKLQIAEKQGVGIYSKDKQFFYDEQKATPTRERLETIYNSKILPMYLKDAIHNQREFWGIGYVTDSFMGDYPEDEIIHLNKKFKEIGAKYKIENNYLHVYWEAK